MMSSIRDSTWKQYNSALKRWCSDRKLDPLVINVDVVLHFFTEWYTQGALYGTLNSARSALALLTSPDLAEDCRLRRFFKGISKLRPSQPRYSNTWDPIVVIKYLRSLGPNDFLNLEDLTAKLVTLLALATAHRIQTFSLIQVDNIEESQEGFNIKIPLPIKTSKRGVTQPTLFLPFFYDDPIVCVASTLKHYLSITDKLRPRSTDRLFITPKRPHRQASVQSLSWWIKAILNKSGIDLTKFSAYSTRHAAVSKASRNGVTLDVIRNAAGWTQTSAMFARFYNRPLVSSNRDAFARAIFSD